MTATLTTPPTYVTAFGQQASRLPGVERLRRQALAAFEHLGFPGERNEDWKFTSLSPLVKVPHQLRHHDEVSPVSLSDVPGVRIMGLRQAVAECPDLVERHLGKYAD